MDPLPDLPDWWSDFPQPNKDGSFTLSNERMGRLVEFVLILDEYLGIQLDKCLKE